MFSGLTNSPACFQCFIMDTLKVPITEGWLVIYMDDILIFSQDLAEHRERTKTVLKILADADLFLKPLKCIFDQRHIKYLGLIICPGQIEMDPVKIQGIQQWPMPIDVKGVHSFLGFCNFYQKFIAGYATLAKPLTRLTKQHTVWQWTTTHADAFNALKVCFTTVPVLIQLDCSCPFHVCTNASLVAIGVELKQMNQVGEMHPCTFFSRALNLAEHNYDIYDCELLAVIAALQHWCTYLLGATHPCEIHTDHKNLLYFKQPHKLMRCQAYWFAYLQEYNLCLVHVPGSMNVIANTLSHSPTIDIAHDNANVTVLPQPLWVTSLSIDDICMAQQDDVFAMTDHSHTPSLSALVYCDHVLHYGTHIYVPLSLHAQLLHNIHNPSVAGHPGFHAMM